MGIGWVRGKTFSHEPGEIWELELGRYTGLSMKEICELSGLSHAYDKDPGAAGAILDLLKEIPVGS